ncbi:MULTISPECIES: permease [Bacillus]|uniref:permease n=1 Tax=Bacillus TaxID=1386 RepID=UPI00065DF225|nr:permease [Bacillus smithii]AKP46536.1 membrane proteinputative [Bacillus smithii]MED4884683.1 permease [Bacillus smithii]
MIVSYLYTFVRNIIGFLLFICLIYLFIHDPSKIDIALPDSIKNQMTIFLSILLESFPFILIGVCFSALIQIFIPEKVIQRIFHKRGLFMLLPAALLGLVFPICECAIIPVIRRFIQKGMPPYIGVTILTAVPIINPIVFFSTYYAFQGQREIVYLRMGLAFFISIVLGILMFICFRRYNPIRNRREVVVQGEEKIEDYPNKGKQFLYHAIDEFFETSKYVIIGSLCVVIFQSFVKRDWLLSLSHHDHASPIIMMGMAYLLSICSESDAFVAKTFVNTFSYSSILAFLVFGPMLDLKNTLMLFSYFKTPFVLTLILFMVAVVYLSVLYLQTAYL